MVFHIIFRQFNGIKTEPLCFCLNGWSFAMLYRRATVMQMAQHMDDSSSHDQDLDLGYCTVAGVRLPCFFEQTSYAKTTHHRYRG